MILWNLGRLALTGGLKNVAQNTWKHQIRCATTVSSEGVHIKWDGDGIVIISPYLIIYGDADYDNQKTVHVSLKRLLKIDDVVKLAWQQEEGYIPLQWLKQHNYSDHQLTKRRKTEPTIVPVGHLPEIDYNGVMDCDEVLWRWLWNLNEYGMCLVNNVPTVPRSVVKVSERISHIQETIHGKVFELFAEDNPANIANTGEGLPLHMDLLYYESPPGLSLLHCLRNDDSVVGGESLLLDSYPIVEDLRNNYPEQFHSLTTIPATFQSIQHTGVPATHLIRRVPHVVLGYHKEIVGVNWCPIAEGALQVSPEDVEPYYLAYLLLTKLFNTSERMLQFRLLPGQLISFNNRRILHGRNSFYSKQRGGVRHLEGLFINIDEFNSRFHVLNGKFGS